MALPNVSLKHDPANNGEGAKCVVMTLSTELGSGISKIRFGIGISETSEVLRNFNICLPR